MENSDQQILGRSFDAAMLRQLGGRFTLRAKGVSMKPLISEGDELDFVACAPEALCVGDVALFQDAQGWMAHRILICESEPLRFYQRGDAEGFGSWLAPEQIAGRLEAVNGKAEPVGYSEQVLRTGCHIGRRHFGDRLRAGVERRMRVWRLRRFLRNSM